MVASQPTQDRNRIQPDSDKGIGTGLVRATQSLQKYIEVHSVAHVDVSAIKLDGKLHCIAKCISLGQSLNES